jgi:hypothetical protein
MITCKYNPQPKKQAKELQRAAAGEGKAGRKSQGGGEGQTAIDNSYNIPPTVRKHKKRLGVRWT